MPRGVIHRAVVSGALLGGLAGAAFGQDYVVSSQSGLYKAPPGSSTLVPLTNTSTRQVTLPFAFPYYGLGYTSVFVCSEGYIQLGVASATATAANAVFPRSGATDGIIAPYWDDLGMNVAGSVREWTTGATPNRVWTVSWEGLAIAAQTTARITFQVRLHEDSGVIEFAYKPNSSPSTWLASTYTPGIDAAGVGDGRWATPAGMNVVSNSGHPPADYRFSPVTRTFTGTLLYDRVASDASGVGNAVFSNTPLSGVRVELRGFNGTLAGAGLTDASGNFTVTGIALASFGTDSLVAMAQGPACAVRPTPGGAVHSTTFATGVPVGTSQAVGTFTLSSAADPGDTYLPAFHVASVVNGARAVLAPMTADVIPPVEVLYDRNSPTATSFSAPVAPSAAVMRVGSAASVNPDAWDTDVILQTWAAGQVLGAVAAYPTAAPVRQFDAISTPENAFAQGFGYAVFAALTGRSQFVDATGPGAATVWDLEAPPLSSRRGDDVAGWAAAALFDLVDAANEFEDDADGTDAGSPTAFAVVDSLTAPVTAGAFHAQWGALGHPGAALTRDFVFHGLLADDAFELNDKETELAELGAAGFRREGLVLNRYDEDWFEVTLDAATETLGADFDAGALAADVVLQIRDASNALLATGTRPNSFSAYTAATGPVPAGTYRVRATHLSGVPVTSYALQVYTKLSVALAPFSAWTVGQAIDRPAPISGGIPPYSFVVDQPFVKPPGIVLDAANQAIRGQPSETGAFDFVLSVRDGGSPRHETSVFQSFVVNPPFVIGVGEFVGLALGRPLDVALARSGGTAPFAFTATGGLPPGTALSADTLRFTGTPGELGAFAIDVDAEDAAGASSSFAPSVVVCAPAGAGATALHVPAGESAAGVWFDALAGSRVDVGVKTARGSAKRTLRPVVLASGGAAVAGGSRSGGLGKAKVAGLVCPVTGRYFVILASDSGSDADLAVTLKVTPPKSGKGADPNLRFGEFVDVPVAALAGAQLVFRGTGDGATGLAVRALGLVGPTGATLPIDGHFVEKGKGFVLTVTLPTAGNWLVRLGPKPGPSGAAKWSYTLKQPKGGAFAIGE